MGKNNYQAGMPGSPGQRLTKWLQEFFLKGEPMAGPYAKSDNSAIQSIFNAMKVTPEMAAKPQGSAWQGMSADPGEAGMAVADPTGMATPTGMGKAAPAQPAAPVNPLHQLPDLKKLSDQELASLAAGGIQAADDELSARMAAQSQ